ncbi:hypothetical protein TKK_0010748 [Trichogramma kaykai]
MLPVTGARLGPLGIILILLVDAVFIQESAQTNPSRFRPTLPPYNESERVEVPDQPEHIPAQGPVYDIEAIGNQPSRSRPPNYNDRRHKDPPPYFSLVDARPPIYQEWANKPIHLDKERPPPRPDSPEFECHDCRSCLKMMGKLMHACIVACCLSLPPGVEPT